MKTKARVSFIIDLDKINQQRALIGRPKLTESEFFEALSDKNAVVIMTTSKDHISADVALGYIVI